MSQNMCEQPPDFAPGEGGSCELPLVSAALHRGMPLVAIEGLVNGPYDNQLQSAMVRVDRWTQNGRYPYGRLVQHIMGGGTPPQTREEAIEAVRGPRGRHRLPYYLAALAVDARAPTEEAFNQFTGRAASRAAEIVIPSRRSSRKKVSKPAPVAAPDSPSAAIPASDLRPDAPVKSRGYFRVTQLVVTEEQRALLEAFPSVILPEHDPTPETSMFSPTIDLERLRGRILDFSDRPDLFVSGHNKLERPVEILSAARIGSNGCTRELSPNERLLFNVLTTVRGESPLRSTIAILDLADEEINEAAAGLLSILSPYKNSKYNVMHIIGAESVDPRYLFKPQMTLVDRRS